MYDTIEALLHKSKHNVLKLLRIVFTMIPGSIIDPTAPPTGAPITKVIYTVTQSHLIFYTLMF